MSDDRYEDRDNEADPTRPMSPQRPGPPQYSEPQQPGPGYAESQPWSSGAQRREYPGAGQPARRSGAGAGFLVALAASVFGIAASLGASYVVAHHRISSLVAEQNVATAGLAGWPVGSARGLSRVVPLRLGTRDFVIVFAIAAAVLLVLLWAAAASMPAGRGAFALFLAGWGATLVAGAVALVAIHLIATDRAQPWQLVSGALNAGAAWAVRIGWIVGLVAAIAQSTRKRDI